MALYKFLENPGREEVDPDELLGEPQGKIDNQDKAKIVVAQLRAKARKEGRQVDYVVVTVKAAEEAAGRPRTGGDGSTSIRVSEAQRKELAKVIGAKMAVTGDAMSMGEALVEVLEENRAMKARLAKLEAKLEKAKG